MEYEFRRTCRMASRVVAAPDVATGGSVEGVSDRPGVRLSGAVVEDTGTRGR